MSTFLSVVTADVVGVEKLVFTPDLKHSVVANKAGIQILKNNPQDEFQKVKAGILNKLGVHSVYLTPSMHILAQETGSNDLILLKGDGTELGRHKGKKSSDFENLKQLVESYRRNGFINNMSSQVLWFRGGGDLGLVNLQNFTFKELKSMIPYVVGQAESVPLKIVHNSEGDRLAYTFLTEGVSCIGVLTPAVTEPDIFIVEDIFPSGTPP